MSTKFYECLTKSVLTEYMLEKIRQTNEAAWFHHLDMNVMLLSPEDFIEDPKLLDVINQFGCHKKLAIFRFKPNTCYQWHIDSTRYASINLQLSGADSLCVFGEYGEPRKINHLEKLIYNKDKYYLLNVSKIHTVFNFNNTRYLLSIGFPIPHTFEDVKKYLISKDV